MVFGNHGKGKEEVRGGSESGDEEWEVEGGRGGLNGEVLREGMERWRGRLVGSGVVWGVGWVVSVVGLWGDGV